MLFQVTRPAPSPGAQEEPWRVSPVCAVVAPTAPDRVLSEMYPELTHYLLERLVKSLIVSNPCCDGVICVLLYAQRQLPAVSCWRGRLTNIESEQVHIYLSIKACSHQQKKLDGLNEHVDSLSDSY